MRMIEWEPIYFDSLGAKSSSVWVKTPDVSILIDPGAAEMQPSYPMPWEEKLEHVWTAQKAIERAAKRSDTV
ncbi:MAG: MBL fold metallo-hydrolase, partial [Nitrososphaerota archaeon]